MNWNCAAVCTGAWMDARFWHCLRRKAGLRMLHRAPTRHAASKSALSFVQAACQRGERRTQGWRVKRGTGLQELRGGCNPFADASEPHVRSSRESAGASFGARR
jgi:hypothetical protein